MSGRLFLGRVLGVSAQLSGAGLLLTSAWLIVRAAEQPPVMFLMVAIVGVRFFGVARTALRYVERLVTHDVALRRVVDVRVRALEAVEQQAGRVADAGRRGDLVRRVVADVDAVQDRLLRVRGPWIVAIATTVTVVIAVGLILPAAAVVLLLGSIAAMAVVRLTGSVSADDSLTAARAELATEVSNEAVAAPDLIVASAISGEKLISKVDRIAALERRAAWRAGSAQGFVLVCTAVATGLIAMLAGGLDPVMVGVVVLAPLALAEPLEALADAERFRPDVESAEQRLQALFDAAPVMGDPAEPAPLPEAWDLEIDNLAVGWTDPLVSGIDASVPAGSAIVVTGRSGVGKSTLALTLARFLQPLAGQVRLGGVDLATMAKADVRSRIGLLSQDEVVFDTTVRENLRVADPEADDAQMEQALIDAGLGPWFVTAKKGLDTMVGEHGSALSGGERQRLAIARLLLAGHRIWVLDEPTEHLDDPTSEQLLADLLALRPRISLIIISHDPRVLGRIDHHLHLSTEPLAPLGGLGRGGPRLVP